MIKPLSALWSEPKLAGEMLSGRSRNLRSRNLVDWTQNDDVSFG
jgi:hypothetical protein